jgi:hypothetical protein
LTGAPRLCDGRIAATARARTSDAAPPPQGTKAGGDLAGRADNVTSIKFQLERSSGANPSVTELDHSPCVYPPCGFGGNP